MFIQINVIGLKISFFRKININFSEANNIFLKKFIINTEILITYLLSVIKYKIVPITIPTIIKNLSSP